MLISTAALIFSSMLFWFGLIKSHWIAPAVFFAASGPVVATFSLEHDALRIAIHLLATLLLFYVAFACGRWAADRPLGGY
ncbi:MAG: hypothetical protein J0H65_09920 [Rhizobiales bacterium]|nr:hypothetical protein [Hyphomicrobiales bacterium]